MDDSPETARGLSPADYLRMVRERWILAGGVFFVVASLVFGQALLQDPVFAARSSVQVDTDAQTAGLSSLFGRATSPQVQSELAVLRSRDVALAAARNKRHTPWVTTVEVNAHRPLEAGLRALGFGRGPAPIRVRTDILPDGRYREEYLLVLSDVAGELIVYKGTDPSGEAARVEGFRFGERFTVHGREFEVEAPPSGEVQGRSYQVTVRSALDTERWIREGASVEGGGSSVIVASCRFETPEIARDVANALALGYVEYRESIKQETLRLRLDSLDKPISTHEKDRHSQAQALDAFLKENDAYFLERKIANFQQSELAIASELARLRGAQATITTRKDRLEGAQSLDDLLAVMSGGWDPLTTRLWREYDDHVRRRSDVIRDGAPADSPMVKKVDADIAQSEAQLIGRLKMAVMRQVEALEAEQAGLTAQVEALEQQEKERAAKFEAALGLQDELLVRRRAIETLDASIAQLRREQSSVRLAVEAAPLGVRLLDQAELPGKRVSPDLIKQGLLAILLGLIFATGGVFVADRLDQRIRSAAELKAGLGLPVLAVIPNYKKVPRRERKGILAALPAYEMPRGIIAESYRMLRAQIRFADREGKARTLAITSPVQFEGKTQTSINVAITIAQTGRKVLLVDADMRRAHVHARIAPLLLEPLTADQVKYGLSYVLENNMVWTGAVQKTRIPELSFLPAGATPEDPGALLDSAAFVNLLQEVKGHYDYVFFDVPPALAVADAASFYAHLDAVILLTRCRRYPIALARRAKDRILEVGGNLLGCILNGFDISRRGSYGDHDYAHHSYYYTADRSPESEAAKASSPLRLRS